MQRKTIHVQIHFDRYIAGPYWPEQEARIAIEKNSRANMQKSPEKRKAAIEAECEKQGLTYGDYEHLIEQSKRPFYRVANDDPESPIVIPAHQLAGSLVNTVGNSPKALRGQFTKENFRFLVRLEDLITDRTEADGSFDRYVKLDTSHMRSRQIHEYIEDFTATGDFHIPDDVKLADVARVWRKAIEETGVGGSRKMGFGRGVITVLEEQHEFAVD